MVLRTINGSWPRLEVGDFGFPLISMRFSVLTLRGITRYILHKLEKGQRTESQNSLFLGGARVSVCS
jgi:hypothetical protein